MSYKAGIIAALTELSGSGSGPSFVAVKRHVQANLPEGAGWSNATFLDTLKKLEVDGDIVESKAVYRLKEADESTKIGTCQYTDGSYEGELKNGKPQGRGTFTASCGDVYEGEYAEGKQHGKGTYKWKEGDIYEGRFVAGLRGGNGLFKYRNGNVYDGEWKDDSKHGKGTFTWADGDVYEGEWEGGLRHGWGTKTWSNGDVYDGEWKNDKKNGKGTFTWENGDVCEGEWEDNAKNGWGKQTYKTGGVYEGQWVGGEPHGKGTRHYANGDVYEGDFVGGKRHGNGAIKWHSGNAYDGQWVGGRPEGTGTKTFASGNVYEGQWVGGKCHGKGTLRLSAGDMYEGQWVEGKRHGKFTWRNSNGIYEQVWANGQQTEGERSTPRRSKGPTYEGELKEGKKHGKGRCRYLTGKVYDGEWKDDLRHGLGTLFRNSRGDIEYEGEWKEGKQHGEGTRTWLNGDTYKGQWAKGRQHGEGNMAFHRKGTLKWEDSAFDIGDVYEGQPRLEGKMHGKGKLTYENGNVYEGEFENGASHGAGKLEYASGDVYNGQWKEGKQHGEGTLKYSSGGIYKGVWTDGQKTQGKATFGKYALSGKEKRKVYDDRESRSQRSQQGRLQTANKTCEHCGADDVRNKLRVCSGCGVALYCSAACQKAASGSHQRICDMRPELPPRDASQLVLKYGGEKLVDMDAGLRYATKYMDNLKHLAINLEELCEDDAIKLSAKKLSSLLKSKKGALNSVSWVSDGVVIPGVPELWKELRGLKQLQLRHLQIDNIQRLYDIIGQQSNTLLVLCLPYLRIDWDSKDSRQTLALAVSFCRNLVKLDLEECLLLDSDLEIMLYDLPNIGSLNLERNLDYFAYRGFTDATCDIIARKCPGLRHLNLVHHHELSMRGIRKIFEGCPQLRSFHTTVHLTRDDIQSLLDTAPQLLLLSLDGEDPVSDEEINEIIDATEGRTLIEFRLTAEIWEPMNIMPRARVQYDRQKELFEIIAAKKDDPEVANEWEDGNLCQKG